MSSKNSHVSAAQMRAARGVLNWAREDLAAASGVSVGTIGQLEGGKISPRGQTTDAIREAFEKNGMEFIEPDGVRRRPDDIVIYHGESGACSFFDEVYRAFIAGAEIVQVWPSSSCFRDVMGSYLNHHVERMTKAAAAGSMKAITTEEPATPAYPFCTYRYLSRHYLDSVPFYVFDDCYAMIPLGYNDASRIVVVQSRAIADSFRKQFNSMWEKATPVA